LGPVLACTGPFKQKCTILAVHRGADLRPRKRPTFRPPGALRVLTSHNTPSVPVNRNWRLTVRRIGFCANGADGCDEESPAFRPGYRLKIQLLCILWGAGRHRLCMTRLQADKSLRNIRGSAVKCLTRGKEAGLLLRREPFMFGLSSHAWR